MAGAAAAEAAHHAAQVVSSTGMLAPIIGLPLLGAAINGLFGKKLPTSAIHTIALLCVGIPALIAWMLFMQLTGLEPHARNLSQVLFPWIHVGGFHVDFALWLDPLSAVMLLIITNIGFLIHLYSIGYMKGDPSYYRFFAYLNLFIFSMLCLVLGESLLLMFLGWEGVGLCSYLLIGFWFEERENAKAGKKAFVVNRIGDFGFALGMMLLFVTFGTLSPVGDGGINAQLAAGLPAGVSVGTIEAAALLLFLGACGKSAQIPLYIWLPDAMAGPTPVSALIHAATMVTAGVYMIARLNGVFFHAEFASEVVLWVGASTALLAATIGLVQNDIKKVLAYSTVSQLGFMFTAMGAGAWAVGMFHLMTHAFFKACLFLGSGSVILAMHHEQDMRYYGGLRRFMPRTYWTFLIATLAISGVPLFSGFFSKDEILWFAQASERGAFGAYALVSLAAFCTAFYMFRIMWMTFWGEHRGVPAGHGHGHHGDDHDGHGHEDHAHDHGDGHGHHGDPQEQPWTMTVPLIVLAALSLLGGYVGLAHVFTGGSIPNYLHDWYHPIFANSHVGLLPVYEASAELTHSAELTGVFVSVAVAVAAILASVWLYRGKDKLHDVFEANFPPLHKVLWNKWYVDEIYEAILVSPIVVASREFLWRIVDEVLIDGLVNFIGGAATNGARLLGKVQDGDTGNYAGWMVAGLFIFGAFAVVATML